VGMLRVWCETQRMQPCRSAMRCNWYDKSRNLKRLFNSNRPNVLLGLVFYDLMRDLFRTVQLSRAYLYYVYTCRYYVCQQ
jgi:hypothetical protein